MAFRPLGVYALTASALYTQTRSTHHLTQMTSLVTQSTSLALLAAGETDASAQLDRASAMDSERGMEGQSEAIEWQTEAERDEEEAMEETVLAEEYQEEAETLRRQSVEDAMESETASAEAQALTAASKEKTIEAGQDLAAAEVYDEQSTFLFQEAANAETAAHEAELRATRDATLALEQRTKSVRDGEALLRTEAGAAEDAEVIAACEVIPLLNVLCDIAGAITETGYQSLAAVEAAKSAVESVAASAWSGREREEWAVAVERQEVAARDVVEAEEYHTLSVEERERAEVERAESASMHESGVEAERIGQEKMTASKEEMALAEVEEEEAARHFAEAAEHEGMAASEEEAAVESQTESEERMAQSTAEELESQSERLDAESKENEARKLMEQSVGQGMYALVHVVSSIVTAAGVVYVVVMKTLAKRVVPAVVSFWKGYHTSSGFRFAQNVSETVMHAGVVFAVVVALERSLSQFEELSPRSRWRSLFDLAVVAGVMESVLIHTLPTSCSCWLRGEDRRTIAMKAGMDFMGGIVHRIPLILIESLILLTLVGPGIFKSRIFQTAQPLPTVGILILLITIYFWFFHVRPFQLEREIMSPCLSRWSEKSTSNRWEEDEFLVDQYTNQNDTLMNSIVDKEYGSMEEVSLLTSSKQPSDNISLLSTPTLNAESSSTTIALMDDFKKKSQQTCHVLHAKLDLLALSLMVMLLYQSSPVIKLLHPLAEKSLDSLGSLFSTPTICAGIAVVVVLFHILFVR
eukprot:CCRYP_012449-RA/>CCRYP_012449-RA protein AED:0.00 eAED:0.00 QI:0/0/0/0.5/1/1/2/0/753